jgi:hypothetical protein
LFGIPFYNSTLAEILARTQIELVMGVPVKILNPCDNLLHVCGHASYSASRQSLRWVTDAWFIMNKHPDLDWNLLFDNIRRNRLALPLSVMLRYMAESLGATIPSNFLGRLSAAASNSEPIDRQLALRGTRSTPQGNLKELFKRAADWRERAFLIQWLLFPSPRYLSWVDQIHPWLLPLHYVVRPLRHAWWFMESKFRGFFQRAKLGIDRCFLRSA